MPEVNTKMLFICLAVCLCVFACADTSKKEAEEAPATQTLATNIEEVTLDVTGMA